LTPAARLGPRETLTYPKEPLDLFSAER
jgi:hypothetical protein